MITDQVIKRTSTQVGQEYAAICAELGDVKHMMHEHEIKTAELHSRLHLLKLEFKEAEAKELKPKVAEDHFVDEAHPFVSDVAP